MFALVGCNESKYRFIFDLSPIKTQEDVSKTELRVYIDVQDNKPSKEYIFTLSYLNNTEIMQQTLEISTSQWITFKVAPAVYEWVKVSSSEPRGFLIKVINTDNKEEEVTCQNGHFKIINLRDDPITQPLLVVYTYDYEPRIFQTLEKALKQQKNDTRERRATIGDLKEKHCSLVDFTVTRNEINSVLGQQGVLMLVPDSLKINLCGGVCEAGKRIRSLHSTLLNLLLSQKDTTVPDARNHTKCCVPIKYESINYVLMDKNKSPPFYETSVLPFVVAKQCGCVYSYTREYSDS